MPQSIINSFDFLDERFIAGQIVQSTSSSDSSTPFEYSAVFPTEIPNQEQMKLTITNNASPGEEIIQGVVVRYGGIYEGDISNITISGEGLSAADKAFILSRISLINRPGSEDFLIVNARDIGLRQPNGIQFFDIHIPYVEQEIIYSPSTQQLEMLTLSHVDAGGPVSDLTVSISGNPRIITIDGGAPVIEVDALSFTDNTNGIAGITSRVNIPQSLATIDFVIDYNLVNQTGIRFVDNHPVYAYLPGDFSTYVYTHVDLIVSSSGSVKNFAGDINRSVVGDQRAVLSMTAYENAWNSLDIQIYEVTGFPSYLRRLQISGTLSNNSFDCLSFAASNTSYQYKIEHFGNNTVMVSVRSSQLEDSVLVQGDGTEAYIRKIVEHNWAAVFGSNFRIDMVNAFKHMPPEMLRTTDWVSCGFPINNPVWHEIQLDGRSRSNTYTIVHTPSQTLADFIDLMLYGDIVTSSPGPWDGWALEAEQVCGDDWRQLASIFLEVFGPVDISSGNTYNINAGGEVRIGDFSVSTSTATLQEVCELIQTDINDSSVRDEMVSVTPNPTHSSLSCSYIVNGNYDSPLTPGSILNVPLLGSFSRNESFSLEANVPLSNLRDQINTALGSVLECEVINGHNDLEQTSLLPTDEAQVITQEGIFLRANATLPLVFTYSSASHTTINSLVSAINDDLFIYGLTATSLGSYRTEDLDEVFPAIDIFNRSRTLTGTTFFDPQPSRPTQELIVSCNIRYAIGGNPNDEMGIQVAFGGYEKDGVFYPNTTPNTFFEPVYNTIFPIEFTTYGADVAYILVRTREDFQGETFSIDENNYDARVSYGNGVPSNSLIPYKPTESVAIEAWTEDFGLPVVVAVPLEITTMSVMIQDVSIVDSLMMSIRNLSPGIDNFGFLGINRTNLTNSQTSSRGGRSYGLVLDNRGVWDILIAPEAEMQQSEDGQFSYLGSFYTYTVEDADESWDFRITNESLLPQEVQEAISITPVANFPRVWALRIESGVKQYLRNLRENAEENSSEGCSIYIDILVTGRETGVQGTCRVYIYYDYTCVYGTQLCDFFWNMVDPPEPLGPEIIDGNLTFAYESLVDCSLIDFDGSSSDNTEVDVPVLVTVNNVPTFENGNALLLMKSKYTADIRRFFFPTGGQLEDIQFSDCEYLEQSLPLALRINRETLWLPTGEVITDINDIRQRIQTESSYMWIRPAFQFPTDDIAKECSEDEVVVIGIGYQFKNWVSGIREEKFIFGTHLVLPVGVISSPELDLCYKYYYNQTEG